MSQNERNSSKNIPTKPSGQTEQQFTILPHPAKTNDPRDLEPTQPGAGLTTQPGAGLTSKPEIGAYYALGPYIPDANIVNSLEEPASEEVLRRRAEELNKKDS